MFISTKSFRMHAVIACLNVLPRDTIAVYPRVADESRMTARKAWRCLYGVCAIRG